MFKVFPWIFQNENQNQLLFLKNWWGRETEANTLALCYFLGLPLINWKWYRPSVNLPPSRCLARMPYTCSASARTHRAYGSSHIALSLDGLGALVTWALFSSGVTAAVGSPENDRLLLLFLLVGRKSEGTRREMFSYTQKLPLDSPIKRTQLLTGFIHSEQVQWKGNPHFFFLVHLKLQL